MRHACTVVYAYAYALRHGYNVRTYVRTYNIYITRTADTRTYAHARYGRYACAHAHYSSRTLRESHALTHGHSNLTLAAASHPYTQLENGVSERKGFLNPIKSLFKKVFFNPEKLFF